MKFTAQLESLTVALEAVGVTRTNKPPIPALGGVKLSVMGERLQIVGSDGELTVGVTIKVADSEEGETLVPAAMLHSVVNSLSGPSVTFAGGEGELEIAAEGGNVVITEMAVASYPKVAIPQGDDIALPARELLAGLAAVAVAADTSRPQACGVLVDPTEEGVRLVATDTYRVACYDITSDTRPFGTAPVFLPLALTKALIKVMKHETQIRVRGEARRVAFSAGNVVIVSRLLDGTFPKYQGLFSRIGNNQLAVNIDELSGALKLARAVLKAGSSEGVRLTLTDAGLSLAASGDEAGRLASGTIKTSQYTGQELTVNVKADFLTDAIDALDGRVAVLRFGTEKDAVLISAQGPSAYRYMCMPLTEDT